ncbi:hypothetical protein J8M97_14575 [Gordonia polyisoprenivorans]|uniref:hypothetical protein n=1 Tax=Gordonia polyisoprenivorans TaxID=84595 RepID=UPI001B8B71DB|nr:hypothetical protein [Gordonia polyisoprenivorans]QUD81066.1 hypothetical protein J8M97_14575 [Gordonia polyisoprenivorans]
MNTMMDGSQRRPDASAATDRLEHPDNLRRRRAWNPAAWTPARSSFTPNRRPSAPRDRRFAPTDHLAPEAVAAYVDEELGMTAHMRATHHLALCPECVAAVEAQTAARTRLRSSGTMPIPTGLLGQLSQIPTREFDMTDHRDPTRPVDRAERGASRRTHPGRVPTGEPTPMPGHNSPGHDSNRGRMQRWRGR